MPQDPPLRRPRLAAAQAPPPRAGIRPARPTRSIRTDGSRSGRSEAGTVRSGENGEQPPVPQQVKFAYIEASTANRTSLMPTDAPPPLRSVGAAGGGGPAENEEKEAAVNMVNVKPVTASLRMSTGTSLGVKIVKPGRTTPVIPEDDETGPGDAAASDGGRRTGRPRAAASENAVGNGEDDTPSSATSLRTRMTALRPKFRADAAVERRSGRQPMAADTPAAQLRDDEIDSQAASDSTYTGYTNSQWRALLERRDREIASLRTELEEAVTRSDILSIEKRKLEEALQNRQGDERDRDSGLGSSTATERKRGDEKMITTLNRQLDAAEEEIREYKDRLQKVMADDGVRRQLNDALARLKTSEAALQSGREKLEKSERAVNDLSDRLAETERELEGSRAALKNLEDGGGDVQQMDREIARERRLREEAEDECDALRAMMKDMSSRTRTPRRMDNGASPEALMRKNEELQEQLTQSMVDVASLRRQNEEVAQSLRAAWRLLRTVENLDIDEGDDRSREEFSVEAFVRRARRMASSYLDMKSAVDESSKRRSQESSRSSRDAALADQQSAEIQRLKEDLQNVRDSADREIEDMVTQMAKFKKEAAASAQQAAGAAELKEQLQQMRKRSENEVGRLQDQVEQLTDELDEARRGSGRDAERLAQQAAEAARAHEEEMASMEERMLTVKEQFARELAEVEGELGDADARAEGLSAKLEAALAEAAEKEAKTQELLARVAVLEQEAKISAEQAERMMGEYRSASEFEQVGEDLQRVKGQLKTLTQRYRDLEADYADQQDELDRLQKGGGGSRADAREQEALLAELDDARRDAADRKAEAEGLRAEYAAREEEMLQRQAELEQELDAILKQFDSVVSRSTDEGERASRLAGEVDALRARVQELEEQLSEGQLKALGDRAGNAKSGAALRQEFGKLIDGIRAEQSKERRRQDAERRRLEDSVRQLKRDREVDLFNRSTKSVQTVGHTLFLFLHLILSAPGGGGGLGTSASAEKRDGLPATARHPPFPTPPPSRFLFL
ncbi:MAG: hypothetical protein BJ554DRAFT_6548 [Olpidium bornovanus]|uniref:Uncharacterized protein n=1 Tax=Olpidium bornovanus TaxID=278681 RepID=A0A8H7ZXQ5_9FUNG|nr:MAG: hypothetical protein BJ554DRAFT_6548 [Olpidium bornovanus]